MSVKMKNIANNILSSLFSIYYLEKNIRDKVQESLLNNSIKKNIFNYYLINNSFLTTFKKIFQYDEIFNYILFRQINGKKDNIIKNELLKEKKNPYDYLLLTDRNKIYLLFKDNNFLSPIFKLNDNIAYFEDYGIIDENIYNLIIAFSKCFNEKITDGGVQKSQAIIDGGKIIIKYSDVLCLLIANLNNEDLYNIERIYNFSSKKEIDEIFKKIKDSTIKEDLCL